MRLREFESDRYLQDINERERPWHDVTDDLLRVSVARLTCRSPSTALRAYWISFHSSAFAPVCGPYTTARMRSSTKRARRGEHARGFSRVRRRPGSSRRPRRVHIGEHQKRRDMADLNGLLGEAPAVRDCV